MAVNNDKTGSWKADVALSVDFYNKWFLQFAPQAFRATRVRTANEVKNALALTNDLRNISPNVLMQNPSILPMLRMSACPPIARDRLIGLSQVSKNLVECMEDPANPRVPPRMKPALVASELAKVANTFNKLADPDIFVWLGAGTNPTTAEIDRASVIIADRLCGSYSDPIIRNAQETRQLDTIERWLLAHGYTKVASGTGARFNSLSPGTFSFRLNVPVQQTDQSGNQKNVNIPVDAVIMPRTAQIGDMPLLIEAKSAGDFTNVNKRRKEEALKIKQLRATHGTNVRFILFLCGYFDSPYLGYEAAEGIDWVWEHRPDDLALFQL